MATLAPGDVVITPLVDRLSRDATDLLVIAATCSAPGPVSAHWPSRSSIPRPDFPEIIFAILGVAAKLERRRISGAHRARPDRRQSQRRQIRPQADAHSAPAAGGPRAARRRKTQRSARSYNVGQSTISRLSL